MSGAGLTLALEPLLVVALAAPLAWRLGSLRGARNALAAATKGAGGPPLDDRDAVCGCSHHLALHAPNDDGATRRCHGTVLLKNVIGKGGRVVDRWEPCPCRRYVGPVPVEELVQARPFGTRAFTGNGTGGVGDGTGAS